MVKEEEEVELKCIIHNARPRPDIIWYMGDKEFVAGRQQFLFKNENINPICFMIVFESILKCQYSYGR